MQSFQIECHVNFTNEKPYIYITTVGAKVLKTLLESTAFPESMKYKIDKSLKLEDLSFLNELPLLTIEQTKLMDLTCVITITITLPRTTLLLYM